MIKDRKVSKKIDKLKGKITKESYEDNYDYSLDDVDERPVIKQIEDDKFNIPKKSRKEKLKEKEEAKKIGKQTII